MDRSTLLAPSLLALMALAFTVACGGVEPPHLSPIGQQTLSPVPERGDGVCDASATWAEPGNGFDAVHRATPLTVHHSAGALTDLAVFTPKGRVPGDVLTTGDRTLFQPWQPWPGHTRVRWRADVCETVVQGAFTTGSVLRPPTDAELAETYLDTPFSLDLRVADWTVPRPREEAAKDDKALTRTAYRFGPAFLVMLTEYTSDTLSLRLAPAVPETSGIYAQDLCRATHEMTVPRGDGAYVRFATTAVTAEARGEPVVLRELDATLGLGRDGYEDGVMRGELDLRDYETEDGRDGCDLFEDLTGHACEPCSTDHVETCTPFSARGLRGILADATPERTGA